MIVLRYENLESGAQLCNNYLCEKEIVSSTAKELWWDVRQLKTDDDNSDICVSLFCEPCYEKLLSTNHTVYHNSEESLILTIITQELSNEN